VTPNAVSGPHAAELSLRFRVAGPPVSELVQTTVLAVLIDIAGDREEALALVSAGQGGGA
jgi:hypothetical protein